MELNSDPAILREAIARRARELWEARGRVEGHAKEDWFQAETEIMNRGAAPAGSPGVESKAAARNRARILMRVDGVLYAGEYDAGSDRYKPGDFRKGQPAEIRFAGDKMYIRCPSGKELETRIVKPTQ